MPALEGYGNHINECVACRGTARQAVAAKVWFDPAYSPDLHMVIQRVAAASRRQSLGHRAFHGVHEIQLYATLSYG